jgi:hypothetical protein
MKENHRALVHDLNDFTELQDRHPIWIVFYTAHIDLCKHFSIRNPSPANGWERFNAGLADIFKNACSPKDARCWDAILGCAKPSVQVRICFEN